MDERYQFSDSENLSNPKDNNKKKKFYWTYHSRTYVAHQSHIEDLKSSQRKKGINYKEITIKLTAKLMMQLKRQYSKC